MDDSTSTAPVSRPLAKKRGWFQVRLSSLLASQAMIGIILYLNQDPKDRAGNGFHPYNWYGFPIQAFRYGDDEISWSDPAVVANICIWVTMIWGTIIGLEILHKIREYGVIPTLIPFKPRLIVVFYFFVCLIVQFSVWIFSSESPHWYGWPYQFHVSNSSAGFINWKRGLICDVYIALAWIAPTTLLLEWWLRRRARLTSDATRP